MADDRKKRPAFDPNRIAAVAQAVGDMTSENVEIKQSRSRRGIDRENTSQVCFRIEKDRHHALKVYAVQNGKEIGELMDDLIAAHLGI